MEKAKIRVSRHLSCGHFSACCCQHVSTNSPVATAQRQG